MADTVTGHAGRYDLISQRVLGETGAKGVVMFVYEGSQGHGMSVSLRPSSALAVQSMLPAILRYMADAIEQGAPPDGVRFTTESKT